MLMRILLAITLLQFSFVSFAQTNMHFTNPAITSIVEGNYDPAAYAEGADYASPEMLVQLIEAGINADSLKQYLTDLSKFQNRNSGSDTLSDDRGIGAARNWLFEKFDAFDQRADDRLETGFFRFDQEICGMTRHKNVVAVLPGTDPEKSLIIVEAHFDSRCDAGCDVDCIAQGIEDNGSGTALVLELARVMSAYRFPHTILFVETTAEEQGLLGANALAEYLEQRNIEIKLVQNNDVIGGIICGETSSPPSCPGLDHIDSTQVRLFSHGAFNSPHKSACRYIKLQYEQMLKPVAEVPMRITIMNSEDRAGRGGDHIPFRMRDYPAVRFTSANEHGDASNDPGYSDRQHTSEDILGLDLNGDDILDTFFVDFNYLARNAAINATSIAMAAIGPDEIPQIDGAYFDGQTFYVEILSPRDYPEYLVGVRTGPHDFDSMHLLQDTTAAFIDIVSPGLFVFISVAGVDSAGVETFFSEELNLLRTGTEDTEFKSGIRLLQNKPNPFDESTTISFWVDTPFDYSSAHISIFDMSGKEIHRIDTHISPGINEVMYFHGYGMSSFLVCALVIDGVVVDRKTMIAGPME